MTAAAVLALPGLWAGLTFAGACLVGSIWLRPAGRGPSGKGPRA